VLINIKLFILNNLNKSLTSYYKLKKQKPWLKKQKKLPRKRAQKKALKKQRRKRLQKGSKTKSPAQRGFFISLFFSLNFTLQKVFLIATINIFVS
jgi:hypothetical protein